ncbi:MAG: hypothetical protein WDN67_03380 [Candidatus Moraniibacteriota bacterium]
MDPQKPYNPSEIEAKWQQFWEKNPLHRPAQKDKYYILDMFPYPSGDGLHVGHVENFTATDIYARFQALPRLFGIAPDGVGTLSACPLRISPSRRASLLSRRRGNL